LFVSGYITKRIEWPEKMVKEFILNPGKCQN
jgi:hypothetical protein